MRYIPVNCVSPGVVIGKTLYNHTGQILLTEGSIVKGNYIGRIKSLGVKGIFIEDIVSKDIEVYNAISEELRQESVKSIKKFFNLGKEAEKKGNVRKFNKQLESMRLMVENIVTDILSHKDIINNIMDIKIFDEYTYYHCTNVAILSVLIGIEIDMSRDDLKTLAMCAILHDVGKVFISTEVLNKTEPLTVEEFDEIRKHSLEGFDYVRDRQMISSVVAQGILDHHEKFDGSGYPYGKKGNKISKFGRIISVADVYDALTSDRVYRKAWSPSEAVEFIMAGNYTAFDPVIVAAFVKKVDPYPVGTAVTLSNGTIGIVTKIEENFPMRPQVRIFIEKGEKVEPYEISLASDLDCLSITILGMADI